MASGLISVGNSFGDQVKKLTNRSELQTGNFVFTLHQRGSFVIILVGLLFSTGNNYLNKDAMICKGGDSYVNNFCFLHGSSHIAKELQGEISVDASCINKDEVDANGDKVRTTHYYIWLPFTFSILAIIARVPGILWKNVFERGQMKKLVKDMDSDGDKTAKRFNKVAKKWGGRQVYNFGFAFCEVLNLVVIIVSAMILNSLLNGEFDTYGRDVHNFDITSEDRGPNPMCHLFPTEVSCNAKSGGISGGDNKDNILCLLPNNAFYQYYFLILWWWYITLFSITCVGLVYRLVQILVPAVGKTRLELMWNTFGIELSKKQKIKAGSFQAWDTFLLARLVGNLKGSQVRQLMVLLDDEGQDNQEVVALIPHREENDTDMRMSVSEM